MTSDLEKEMERRRQLAVRGWREIGVGVLFGAIAVGCLLWADQGIGKYFTAFMISVVGFCAMVMGVVHLLRYEAAGRTKPGQMQQHTGDHLELGFGFKSFVAWRYLMARQHRMSRIILFAILSLSFLAAMSILAERGIVVAATKWDRELVMRFAVAVVILKIASFTLLFFAIVIGGLRYVFSFFTTVPLVGVWIGTGALVCVLAVMSGFETDLRQKILGSSAHIQIKREEGDFTDWREVKAKIDKLPGVLASSPYAESEVVIAANGNGMPVIIKGIDPETIGKVTDLINDLDDKDAIKRLYPLVEDTGHLVVPQQPTKPGKVVDPPPSDMPSSGEPIDFSQPKPDPSDAIDPQQPPIIDDPPPITDEPPPIIDDRPPLDPPPPRSGSAARAGSQAAGSGAKASAAQVGSDFGGDAKHVLDDKPTFDPPPPDLITTDDEPIDYSGEGDEAIHVIDVPMDSGAMSKRTQSLPGILVGKELVKQIHLYTGEEVRIVSPLSDPANPDATGTPIPFNRDYRIAGTFFTGMYEYDLKYVYVTLDSLTDFLDRGDVVDGIEVRIKNADDTDIYVGRLQTLLGKQYRVKDWKELNRSLFSALKLEKIAMFLVLGIVILVASFSIVGNLIMVVVEKGREIALLKTLGASDFNVMLIFAIQGLLIGVIGTALGIGTGLVACYLGKEYGIPLDPNVYYIDRMPVHVDEASVLLTALAGILISMAATFYPALVAARVRPAAGMRH